MTHLFPQIFLDKTDLFFSNGYMNDPVYREPTKVEYPVDIFVDKITGELVIETAVVGIDKNDIKVNVTDGNILTIEYTKDKDINIDENRDYTNGVKSITHKSFKHKWKIAPKFDLSKVTPKLKRGLLSVRIGQSDDHKARSIKIN